MDYLCHAAKLIKNASDFLQLKADFKGLCAENLLDLMICVILVLCENAELIHKSVGTLYLAAVFFTLTSPTATTMIELHRNEITFYYNSRKENDRKLLAYAISHYEHVREVDVSSYVPTGTRFEEIAMRLGLALTDLIDRNSPAFEEVKNQLNGLHDNDLIKMFQHTPELLRTPIIVAQDKAAIVSHKGQIIHLEEVE